jgi:hypothetical protein
MSSSKENFPKYILILFTIIYGVLILALPLYVFVTGFFFDAPGSSSNPFIYLAIVGILTFPVSLSVSLYKSWKHKDDFDVCWKNLKLPIKHIGVICVIWILIVLFSLLNRKL